MNRSRLGLLLFAVLALMTIRAGQGHATGALHVIDSGTTDKGVYVEDNGDLYIYDSTLNAIYRFDSLTGNTLPVQYQSKLYESADCTDADPPDPLAYYAHAMKSDRHTFQYVGDSTYYRITATGVKTINSKRLASGSCQSVDGESITVGTALSSVAVPASLSAPLTIEID